MYIHTIQGTVVVVIIWYLDLKLLVQSLPITTKVVSSNLIHGEIYWIQHYVVKFVIDLRQVKPRRSPEWYGRNPNKFVLYCTLYAINIFSDFQ
jgi:hypothetical protein